MWGILYKGFTSKISYSDKLVTWKANLFDIRDGWIKLRKVLILYI